jgi:hypothetical protein
MIQLRRKTAGRGVSKIVATRPQGRGTRPYYRWNTVEQRYDFCLEIYSDKGDGVTYEVVGSQMDWATIIDEMQKNFAEAPA